MTSRLYLFFARGQVSTAGEYRAPRSRAPYRRNLRLSLRLRWATASALAPALQVPSCTWAPVHAVLSVCIDTVPLLPLLPTQSLSSSARVRHLSHSAGQRPLAQYVLSNSYVSTRMEGGVFEGCLTAWPHLASCGPSDVGTNVCTWYGASSRPLSSVASPIQSNCFPLTAFASWPHITTDWLKAWRLIWACLHCWYQRW